jgi:hypothetical protein
MSGAHTTASATLDMFTLARNIFTGDLATPRDTSIMGGYRKLLSLAPCSLVWTYREQQE